MRVIKFRAWHEGNKSKTGAFYKGHEPKMLYDGKHGDSLRWLTEGQNITNVMQFTGLLDKNGKEIYEGDVVKTPNGDWGVIQYEAPFFGVTVSAVYVSNYRRDWMETCEVIGNIYENSELLEVA